MKLRKLIRSTSRSAVGVVVSMALLSGCSTAGGQPTPPAPPRFVTYIDAAGVKHFTLMADGPPAGARRGPPPGGRGGPGGPGSSGGPPPGGPGGGPGGGPPGDGMPPRGEGRSGDPAAMQAHLQAGLRGLLDDRLAESGYCHEGYQELDSSFEAGGARIAGRCNETATDLDRSTFPNAQQ